MQLFNCVEKRVSHKEGVEVHLVWNIKGTNVRDVLVVLILCS